MDNSNIIISVIIVLCIAAGVTAYSLTNDDNVFTDLEGITPSSGDDGGLGDNGIGNTSNGDMGTNVAPSSGSSSSGSSSSSSGSGTGSGSGSGSGQGHNPTPSKYISREKAKSIASSCVAEPGCYIKSVSRSGDVYYCYVANKEGKRVDCIVVNAVDGSVIGRG